MEKSIEFANHIIECVKNKNVETIPTFGEKYQMRGTSVECKLHYNLKTRSHEVMLQEVTITIPSGGTNKKMSPFVLIQFYPHSFQPAFIKQYKLFSENALHIDLYKNGHFKNLSVGNVVGDDVPKIINRKESKKDIDAVQNEQLLEKNKTGKLAIYRWDEQGQLIQSAAHSYSTEDDLFHKIFPNGVILKK
ncbi:MAG: hypothetical protein LBJ67_00250 [Planctomycetaceae bacterium]|nr:hypothetical protein [Planctomycetaceae bacterium]